MSILYISPPKNRYDLKQVILGEASGLTSDLVQVASSLIVGSFPTWITSYEYAGVSGSYYYAVKWEYNNGGYSDWSSPRVIGRTGIDTNYIIVNAPSISSLYIMNPVSGDIATTAADWFANNREYYVTIDKSLSGSLTLPLGENYVFTFTSAYCPLFASVNEVRFEAGEFVNNLTDDTINRIIHKNSKYIINRVNNLGVSVSGTYTCDGLLLNAAFRQYVLCKSALDSITAIQLSMGGQSLKQLGDMKIGYTNLNTDKDPMNKKMDLKECIDTSLSIILSSNSFKVGVRGIYHSKLPHPMNDPTYGRLSITNLDDSYNMNSIFDN